MTSQKIANTTVKYNSLRRGSKSSNESFLGRRPFLKGSGLAMFGGLMAGNSNAQSINVSAELSVEERANIQLVNDFCSAWATLDLRQVTALMTESSVYRMTEDTPSVTGSQALIDQMQPWVDTSNAIEFKVLETFARGPMVINHRIDTFSSDTRPLTWEGVGVFLVKEGKIIEWSDYTIQVG